MDLRAAGRNSERSLGQSPGRSRREVTRAGDATVIRRRHLPRRASGSDPEAQAEGRAERKSEAGPPRRIADGVCVSSLNGVAPRAITRSSPIRDGRILFSDACPIREVRKRTGSGERSVAGGRWSEPKSFPRARGRWKLPDQRPGPGSPCRAWTAKAEYMKQCWTIRTHSAGGQV